MDSHSFSIAYCQPSRVPAVPAHPRVDFQAGRLVLTLFTPQPQASTVTQIQTGVLQYGWVEPLAGFPLLLLAAGEWLIETGLNLLRVPGAGAEAWLANPGAELHLVLLDAGTTTLLVERTLRTVPAFAQGLRDCLASQYAQARTAQVAEEVYQLLLQAHSPHELRREAILYKTNCPSPTRRGR